MPSQIYFSQIALPALYAKTRETVSNELEELKGGGYFVATTDLWSSTTSEPYISYTIHFTTTVGVIFSMPLRGYR